MFYLGQGAFPNPLPIGREFFFRRCYCIRKQLKDVLSRHTNALRRACVGRTCRAGFQRSFEIITQSLENSLPKKPIVRQRPIFDLSIDCRFDPRSLRLFDRDAKRRVFPDEGI